MQEYIYVSHAEDTDITFILKDIIEDDAVISTEVTGFYYGSPDEQNIEKYKNSLKAEY